MSKNQSRNVPLFDSNVPVINEEHKEIHEGEMFFASHDHARNDGEVSEMLVVTGNTRTLVHMFFTFSSLLASSWALYEGTSKAYVSDNAVTVFNRYRSSPKTPQTGFQVCHTPSGSGDGTKLASGFCGSDTGPKGPGGTSRDQAELILKPGTSYLMRITSAANSNTVVKEIDFYEHFAPTAQTTTTTTTSTTTTTA